MKVSLIETDNNISDFRDKSDCKEESHSEESSLKENIKEDNCESLNDEQPLAECILLW